MYNEAFQNNNFAYSAAISCFLLAPVLVLYIFMGKYLISGQMSGAVTAS